MPRISTKRLRNGKSLSSSHGGRAVVSGMANARFPFRDPLAGRCGPAGEISDVGSNVRSRSGVRSHARSLRFGDEGGCATSRIPVVVGEMVEAGMSHGASQRAAVLVAAALESDNQIKEPPAGGAVAYGDDACGLVLRWSAHRAFVRMRGEEFERAFSVVRIEEQRVNRLDRCDPLEVAVRSGVIVW